MGKFTRTVRERKPRWRHGVMVVAALLAAAIAGPVVSAPAQAYDAAAFNPGNIIDDALFYDGGALSAAQVQTFLNERVPRCTIGDPGRAAGSPYGSTFIADSCLRDFRMTTSSRAANAYCMAYAGAANETAASIIAKVGAACGVSQKVLLVMLEKEQSLVSDTWPTRRQFDVAMGYACPDSGPGGTANCDPTQTGFFQQVYRAAWQIKVYRAHPDSYNYRPGWNNIQWSVPISCGTSQVYIENWATAALYIYTPYRPNQAALDAGWGTGDACSTYGNRNFANFYRGWFGPTHASPQVLGDLNTATPTQGGIAVRGWAGDPKAPGSPRNVQFYVGNYGYQLAANQARPDVAAVYPNLGGSTGFSGTLTGNWSGQQRVCAYASVQLGCATVDFGVHAPRGDVNGIGFEGQQLVVRGWAADGDRPTSPIQVHVYVGAEGTAVTADRPRPDVAQVYPQYGPNHGFEWRVAASKWAGTTQRVCVYGINVAPGGGTFGANPLLKPCTDVAFPASLADQAPVGRIDGASVADDSLTVNGWAFDPDVTGAIDVRVSFGGQRWDVPANRSRPDVAQAYRLPNDLHGYSFTVPVQPEWPNPGRLCVTALNVDRTGARTGGETSLGCRDVAWVQDAGRSLP